MDQMVAMIAMFENLKISTNNRPKEETKLQPYISMIALIDQMGAVLANLKPDEQEKIHKAYQEFSERIKKIKNVFPQQFHDLYSLYERSKGRHADQSKKIWDCRWNRTGVHQFYRINDYRNDKLSVKHVGNCGYTKDNKRTYCCDKCKLKVKNYLNIQSV